MRVASLRPVVLVLAASCAAWPSVAPAKSMTFKRKTTLSLESGLDSNPRRIQNPRLNEEPVCYDVLSYIYTSTQVQGRAKKSVLRFDANLGGRMYQQTPTENLLAGRLKLGWSQRFTRTLVGVIDLGYEDKFQRGGPVAYQWCHEEPVKDPPLPTNARDYRRASLRLGSDIRFGKSFSLRIRGGGSAFQYKPAQAFSFAGPDATLSVAYRLSHAHVFTAFVGGHVRWYHPASFFYIETPGGGQVALDPTQGDRLERAVHGGAGYSYRGPVIVSLIWTVVRTFNNSDGYDVLRSRVELSGAGKIGRRLTLVFSGALQSAVYPRGRGTANVGDEDEQQNSLALKLSYKITEQVSLTVKAQGYSSELSNLAVPFLRGFLQAGARVEF